MNGTATKEGFVFPSDPLASEARDAPDLYHTVHLAEIHPVLGEHKEELVTYSAGGYKREY